MVNIELVIELARLYKKYGADSFKELEMYLKNPSNVEDIVSILNHSSKLNQKESKRPARKKESYIQSPKILNILKDTDPEKYKFLDEFYQKLISKEILSSIKDIKFFREDNGLSPLNVKSHSEAIKTLITDLSNFPLERLKKIDVVSATENTGLQGWSDIILKKK